MMHRKILHIDMNCFYANVECFYNPTIRDKEVAVCGSVEDRHGIVLAANRLAKKFEVKTGDPVWLATKKCRRLVIVEPHYERYLNHSNAAWDIYNDYSPRVERFGLDECWLDITGSEHILGSAPVVADEIRERIKFELGITCSVGLSDNKITAKLASDMASDDSTMVITPENYKEVVWPLPASDLLYVGPATKEKLHRRGIDTIGQLAQSSPDMLHRMLGKWGTTLHGFANGLDTSSVREAGSFVPDKSVGNSTTCPKDLTDPAQIRITVMVLAESVAARLREQHSKCRTIQVWLRYADLTGYQRQQGLKFESATAQTIGDKAMELILKHWNKTPLRAIGIKAANLVPDHYPQLSLFPDIKAEQKQEDLESAIDIIRRRFGHFSVQRGIMLTDIDLSSLSPKEEHIIHPVSFFR